jgi:hypothetical protein
VTAAAALGPPGDALGPPGDALGSPGDALGPPGDPPGGAPGPPGVAPVGLAAVPEVVHRPPRTPAGEYLRATAINRPAGWNVRPDHAARAFFARAFTLAVRRRFRPDSPVADIARTVAGGCHRHAALALSALETEMLVRHALGEAVPVEDIPAERVVAAHVIMFVALVDEVALTDDEVDALITTAEDTPGWLT